MVHTSWRGLVRLCMQARVLIRALEEEVDELMKQLREAEEQARNMRAKNEGYAMHHASMLGPHDTGHAALSQLTLGSENGCLIW